MSTQSVGTLHALRDVLNQAIQSVTEEWVAHGTPNDLVDATKSTKGSALPTPRCYEATKVALGAAGMIQALLKDPRDHLMEIASQYLEARALHAASAGRIPDILYEASLAGKKDGLTAEEISAATGYEPKKCARFMRLLATNHVFNQTGPERFSNNRSSATLIHNEALSNYIDLYGAEWYASSQHLLNAFKDPSHELGTAAFTKDILYNNGNKTYWAYNDENAARHDMFATAMSGSAQSNVDALLSDYPWDVLGRATLVDVGGGVGTLSLPLLARYPDLSVVIQDRAPVIAQAKAYWEKHFLSAVESARVNFQTADFFQLNQVPGADVYMLRYIMDDWNDDACVRILSAIKEAMDPKSRVLIVEALLIPSWLPSAGGACALTTAPRPLLPNYGTAQRFIHCRDMNMMSLINGTERTATEMTNVVQRAGLKVDKIWACRAAMYITECTKHET